MIQVEQIYQDFFDDNSWSAKNYFRIYQASSRVGREKGKPGLVLTILSPFRPRDRSHYEKFQSYHENLYKFVEPTSITSHSDQLDQDVCMQLLLVLQDYGVVHLD